MNRFALLCVAVATIAVAGSACFGGGGGSATPTPARTPTATGEPTSPPTTGPGTPTSPASPSATPTGETPPTATPTPVSGTISYTIVRGDTLFSLARRFGTTVEAITSLNGIADPNTIEVGDTILIPTSGTPIPTATSSPGSASTRIDHGPRGTNRVALTFDMGGRVEPALDIMNYLVANNVRATIFMTGAMAENRNTDAGRQVLGIIQANQQLFELGNHSYSHPDFRDLTDAAIADELRRTETAVAKYTTVTMPPLFRPPYGGVDADVLRAVGALGYSRTIMWDVDTIDWRPPEDGGPSASAMVTKVLNNSQGGSIVIMHLGGYNTFEALPGIVDGLRNAGFELVTVSELLE
jgi:peptidoglycan/xylan/chitin deacetylase (PgdA/CDA1 family)